MAHAPKNTAIAMRDGVSASCIALPRMRQPPWPTVLAFLIDRLPVITADDWYERMASGQVMDEQGKALPLSAPYAHGARVYYWRSLPAEPEIPFTESIVWQDEHLVVADKPHFLPVTPGGRYVQQTLLVRLKKRLDLPHLSPLHRIDRETAGLVVFSVRPEERDAYQQLFRHRQIHKSYQAIAAHAPELGWPRTHRSHLREQEGAFYKMREASANEGLPPNSETRIDLLESRGRWARYHLEPISGKRHQLRVHMNALGLPLYGDQFYPEVKRGPNEAEDFAEPLRLLAQGIAFTDPITGEPRAYTSQRTLAWPA